jgi:sulfur relay (sulfurtransferase) DsrF/TusC family protein
VQSATYFTADLDDGLTLAADFNDAEALGSKEITALKKIYRKYGILSLSPVEQTLRSSTG